MGSALSGRVLLVTVCAATVVSVVAVTSCKSDSVTPPIVTPPVVPPSSDTTSTATPFGLRWSQLPNSPSYGSASDAFGHFMDASFITPDEGWVVGIQGDMYHTSVQLESHTLWESTSSSTSLRRDSWPTRTARACPESGQPPESRDKTPR